MAIVNTNTAPILQEGTNITLTQTGQTITITSSAGSAAGGDPTEVQYNSGGALEGDPSFTYNDTTNVVSLESVDFATTPAAADAERRLKWDNDEGSLVLTLKGGNVTIPIGAEVVSLVYNAEATTLTKGTVVYAFGASGQRVSVKKAVNTADATSAQTFGVIAESIAAGAEGFCMVQGMVRGIDTSAYVQGDPIYLSATAGQFTKTKPVAPNHLVYIGFVVKVNASSGEIFVRPQNGYEMDEIHDYLEGSVQNNDVISYESSSGLYKPKSIPTLLGYTPANQATTITINGTSYDLSINRTWSVGTVGGSTGSIDNAILRADGTGGSTLQSSSIILSDTADLTLGTSSLAGNRIITTDGSATNIQLYIRSKGNGSINLQNNFGGSDTRDISVGQTTISSTNTASATNNATTQLWSDRFYVRKQTANTNTVEYPLEISNQTSGSPAVGIGTGLRFLTQTGGSNYTYGSTIESVSTNITSPTEAFDLVFKTMAGGATASEKIRLISTGQLKLNSYTSTSSFTGTAAGYLAFDSSGNIITTAAPSITETDTLATVTARGASTSTNVTLSGTGNQFSGHHYFLPWDADGNHYPHYNIGGNNNGSKLNLRMFGGNGSVTRVFYLNGNDGGISWDGNTLLHAGNYTSYAVHASTTQLGATNLNDFTTTGHYFADTNYSSVTNIPYANYFTMLHLQGGSGRRAQLWFGDTPSSTGSGIFWRPRQGDSTGWHPWERLLTSANYNSYSPTLTGGGASGTWSIKIRGTDNTYANGLLQSGAGRTDDAAGDTWIFSDTLGSDSNKWGIKHNQADNNIEFWGNNARRAYVELATGHIYTNYVLGSYFNASAGNSENPTIGQVWTQSTGDNYLRKSTPAHFISELGLITSSSIGSQSVSYANSAAKIASPYQEWDFNTGSHQTTPMSISLWDNYVQSGAPSTYGTLIDIYGLSGHQEDQLYFNQGTIRHRYGWYGDDNWSGWRTIITSDNIGSYTSGSVTVGTNSGSAWYPLVHSSGNSLYKTGATLNYPLVYAATGYIETSYIATTDDVSTNNISHIVAKFNDNYHRSATSTKVREFLGLATGSSVTFESITADVFYDKFNTNRYVNPTNGTSIYTDGDAYGSNLYYSKLIDWNNTNCYVDPDGYSALNRGSGYNMRVDNGSSADSYALFYYNRVYRGAIAEFYRNETYCGAIVVTDSNTTTYAPNSDYRLKENIVDYTNGIETIMKMKPKKFRWKLSKTDSAGFIAHELQEVIHDIIPETVTEHKDAIKEDGTPRYQGVDSSKLVPILVAGIQEQQIQIQNLTQELQTIKKQIQCQT